MRYKLRQLGDIRRNPHQDLLEVFVGLANKSQEQ